MFKFCTHAHTPCKFSIPTQIVHVFWFFLPLQGLTQDQLENMPTEELVLRLDPRTLEHFFTKHGLSTHYSTQLKLCNVDEAPSCWWCKRFIVRRCLGMDFLPCNTQPDGSGGWIAFAQRTAELGASDPGLREQARSAYLTDLHLPSSILQNAFDDRVRTPCATPEALARLAAATNLSPASVALVLNKHEAKHQTSNRARAPVRPPPPPQLAPAPAPAMQALELARAPPALAQAAPPALLPVPPTLASVFQQALFWQRTQVIWSLQMAQRAAAQQAVAQQAARAAEAAALDEADRAILEASTAEPSLALPAAEMPSPELASAHQPRFSQRLAAHLPARPSTSAAAGGRGAPVDGRRHRQPNTRYSDYAT